MDSPSPHISKHPFVCPLCEANCGIVLDVDVEKQIVLSARGDKDDPFSRGFNCAKVHALVKLPQDTDLVRRPLRKRGRDFEEISWDEAIDEIADRTKALQREHGKNSIAAYFGNATIHHPGLVMYGLAFAQSLETTNLYATSSIDHAPKLLSSGLLFGAQSSLPVPDIDRTKYLIIMGANPVASGGSLLTAPGMPDRIKAVTARGGKVVVIDPRRTETAMIADQHISIRPSTDAQLLFAMLNVAFDKGLTTLGDVADYVKPDQVDVVRRLASKYPPARVAAMTGIDTDIITTLAIEFFTAERAACYGRIGTSLQRFGSLTSWLVDVLNILSGNLDRPGGAMFPSTVVPPMLLNDKYDGDQPPYAKRRSRVSGMPEIAGIMPAVTLAEEITTPGDGQIRGLFVISGNPVSSIPNFSRNLDAFRQLDLQVSVDIYINETSKLADFILPTPPTVQAPAFPLFSAPYMVRSYMRYSPAALNLEAGAMEDWRLMVKLAARISDVEPALYEENLINDLIDVYLPQHPRGAEVSKAAARAALGDEPGPERYLDLLVRSGIHGDCFGLLPDGMTLDMLKQHPHGIDLGAMTPRMPAVLATPDRHIDLTPSVIIADEARLDNYCPEDELILVGRRHVRSVNSWMNNLHFLTKGKNPCLLLINPADAERIGVESGERVRVSSRERAIEVVVNVSDTMMEGVVSLPHGYGQTNERTKLSGASELDTANFNDISDETDVDVPSATPALGSVSVTIEKVTAAV